MRYAVAVWINLTEWNRTLVGILGGGASVEVECRVVRAGASVTEYWVNTFITWFSPSKPIFHASGTPWKRPNQLEKVRFYFLVSSLLGSQQSLEGGIPLLRSFSRFLPALGSFSLPWRGLRLGGCANILWNKWFIDYKLWCIYLNKN